jgi:hypothetical protein
MARRIREGMAADDASDLLAGLDKHYARVACSPERSVLPVENFYTS